MNKFGKGVLIAGIVTGSFLGIRKLASIKKAGDQLSLRIDKVHGADWAGGLLLWQAYLKFKVDLKLSNPSNKQFNISFPSVKVLYNDNEVGNTIPKNQNIILQPVSEIQVKNIEFEIPALKMFTSLDTVNVQKMIEQITLDIYVTVNGMELHFPYKLPEV